MLVFTVAAILRAIPEVLAGPYLVGFDVSAYYPYYITVNPNVALPQVLSTAPLFYWIMSTIRTLSGVEVDTLLKVTGPILYGSLAVSFLLFFRFFLKFNLTKSSVGTLIFVLQPISLRISWDLFRNELGLLLMFLTLGLLGTEWAARYFASGSLALVVVLSHPYVAILMCAALLFRVLYKIEKLRILAYYSPAIVLLALALVTANGSSPSSDRLIFIPSRPQLATSHVLYNVFTDESRFSTTGYLGLISSIGALLFFSYVPMSYFAIKGRFSEPSLNGMMACLCLGSFSVLALPAMSVPVYWRWIILLVIPLAIFATRGIDRLGGFEPANRKYLGALLLSLLIVAVGYSSGTFSYMGSYGVSSFAPQTLVQSSIAVTQVDDATAALRWLNYSAPSNSRLLTDERFISLALMNTGRQVLVIVKPGGPPDQSTASYVSRFGHGGLYLIWETGFRLCGYEQVHMARSVSIYRYNPDLNC